MKKPPELILFYQKGSGKLLTIMKLSVLFLLVSFLQVSGNAFSQGNLDISSEEITVREVIKIIENQTNYRFFYNASLPLLNDKKSINARDKSVEEVLSGIVAGTPYHFEIFENQLIVLSEGEAFQPRQITGHITDAETGEPLIGVNIVLEGTTIGVISDFNGRYSINIPGNESILIFSYIGYNIEKLAVGNNTVMDVKLVTDISALEEVVVVGYGSQKKITITGAVSSVNTENMIKSPASSVQNALAGRASGIITVQRSSEPGRDYADIYIRGQATYGNSRPLILVDGIERDITTLDPNEVESINVLKDASSTAVFGVRGANGVIVVTTKTGHTASKPQVSFTANYGLSSPIRIPRLLNSDEWATFFNMGSRNDDHTNPNWLPTFSETDIELYASGEDPVFHPNNDWVDILVKEYVPQQQYNLNITGGSKMAKYFVSLGYFAQEGAFKKVELFDDFDVNSSIERYNIRANTDFQWTKNFSTSIKFSNQITKGKYPGGANSDVYLNNVFTSSPIGASAVIDGKVIHDVPELTKFKTTGNPIILFYSNGSQILYQARTSVDLSSIYKLDALLEGLSVRGKFAYDNFYSQSVTRNKNIDTYVVHRTKPGIEEGYYAMVQQAYEGPWFTDGQSYNQNHRIYSEAALDYNRTLTGGHTLSGIFLGTMERSFRGGSPALPYNYMGLVGRATYNYKRRYILEANIGYNGSENFARGKQFGFFPAFSMGYVISEENFFPENDMITFVKIRGSKGKVGNDRIGGERFLYTPSSYSIVNNLLFLGPNQLNQGVYRFGQAYTPVSGYNEMKIGNPDITWEVADKTNIGAEFKFFKDKLSLTGDFFQERRTGILGNFQNLPFSFGNISLLPAYNLGTVDNQGYEFELGYSNPSDKKLKYFLSANYTFARNTLVFNDEIPPAYPNLVRTGKRIGQPFMLVSDGLYNTQDEINDPERIKSIWEAAEVLQPGDIKYVDVNGDGIIDLNDEQAVGYSNIPEIIFGITAGINWKGFDMTLLIQGADHVSTYYGNKTVFSLGYGARTEAAYDAWTEEKYLRGDEILYPRISLKNNNTHNTQTNSLLMQNARYVRIKNLEIGYSFNQNLSRKFGSNMFRIYVNSHNLLTITPMKYWDPDMVRGSNMQYPMTRVINMGLRANF